MNNNLISGRDVSLSPRQWPTVLQTPMYAETSEVRLCKKLNFFLLLFLTVLTGVFSQRKQKLSEDFQFSRGLRKMIYCCIFDSARFYATKKNCSNKRL